MTDLKRIGESNLFSIGGTIATKHGVLFHPSNTEAGDTLVLDDDQVSTGAFACWTDSIPTESDLTEIEGALSSQVSNGGVTRLIIQFFRLGQNETDPIQDIGVIEATADIVNEVTISMRDNKAKAINHAHKVRVARSRLGIFDGTLVFSAIDGSNHSLRIRNQRKKFDRLNIDLSGASAGALRGALEMSADELVQFRFLSILSESGAKLSGGIGKKHYPVKKEERPIIRGGGRNGDEPVEMGFVFDPGNMLEPERSHFLVEGPDVVLTEFKSTLGHSVAFDLGQEMRSFERPRFSFVRNRTREFPDGNGREPHYTGVSLLLEGDVPLAFLNRDGSNWAPGGAERQSDEPELMGIFIGDTPHEYLEVPNISNMVDAPVRLHLRRGVGHIRPRTKSLNGPEPLRFDFREEGHDLISWARISRGGSLGAPISEARSMRRFSSEGAPKGLAAHDPFRLTFRNPVGRAIPEGYIPVLPLIDDGPGSRAGHNGAIVTNLAAERRKLLKLGASANGIERSSKDEFRSSEVREWRQTPLGFKFGVNNEGTVVEVVIAQTREIDQNKELIKGDLSIKAKSDDIGLSSEIFDDLVRNQLFMMINSDAPTDTPTQPHFELDGAVSMSAWGFKLNLATPWEKPDEDVGRDDNPGKAPPPLLIVKGFEGRSIKELVEEENEVLWTGRRYLAVPEGEGDATTYARNLVKEAHDRCFEKPNDGEGGKPKVRPHYRALHDALTNPAWNGTLVLHMELNLGVLPAQIKGLMGGIDMGKLRADHFGLPIRRMEAADQIPLSKPFALIDYENFDPVKGTLAETGDFTGPKQAGNGSDELFEMTVTRLVVGFANGKLQNFDCDVALEIGALFHDKSARTLVQKDKTASKTVDLKGKFERRKVDGVEIEIYTFLTEVQYEIVTDSVPLVKKVLIERFTFITRTVEKTGSKETLECSFSADGEIIPKPIGGLNFLDVEKVSFKGLSIDMRFDIGDGSTSPLKFRFNPGAIVFDFDTAKRKSGERGFWSSMPLKFSGFGWLGSELGLLDLGYVALGRSSGDDAKAPFLLKFDLDLGTLGALAPALAKINMNLGLVFGFDANNRPHFDLGFKFGESGGKDLSIGLQGVLEFYCKRYEVVSLKHIEENGEELSYYGFKGVQARLKVFGKALPPDEDSQVGVYLFAAPKRLDSSDGLGWLLSVNNAVDNDIIELDQITLGQRVDPLRDFDVPRPNTEKVLEALNDLAAGHLDDKFKDGELTIPDVRYDPTRGWTIAFDATVYKFIRLGFAMRDPDLAGILLEVLAGDTSLFKLDVLYRKLSDNLGVYSMEVTLPPSLRNWQYGAAGFTLPVIGIEVFTNGDWGIDLGFPWGRDYSRSFAVSVVPFVGAGGLYFRRVSGPGANLVTAKPKAKSGPDDERLIYDPVVEAGMAMRVGLGITLSQGILNAGISITVYGSLQGGIGKLNNPNPDEIKTDAARTYIYVSGAVGLMGELYGYVDFKIIKAGIFVQVYVEFGFIFETDKAFVIYMQIGVTVRVRVVIARIKIFGKSIEIAVCFGFDATLPISQKIGRDNRVAYSDGQVKSLREARRLIEPLDPLDWAARPEPGDWSDDLKGRINMPVIVQPDITFVKDDADVEPHVVMLMIADLGTRESDVPAAVERLVQGITAWALAAQFGNGPGTPIKDVTVEKKRLEELAAGLSDPLATGPSYAEISKFLATAFEGTATTQGAGGADKQGAILPLPQSLTMMLDDDSGATKSFSFAEFAFVDETYREKVDELTDRFLLSQDPGRNGNRSQKADAILQSLTAVLFEEWVQVIMRAGINWIAAHVQGADDDAPFRVSVLLDELVSKASRSKTENPLRSAAAEIVAMASRFFTYGARLPEPDNKANLPDWHEVPSPAPSHHYFRSVFRMAGTQFPLGDTKDIIIKDGVYDGWLTVPKDYNFPLEYSEVLEKMQGEAESGAIGVVPEIGRLFLRKKRHLSIGSFGAALQLSDTAGDRRLWQFDQDVRDVFRSLEVKPELVKTDPTTSGNSTFDELEKKDEAKFRPAISIDLVLNNPAPNVLKNPDGTDANPVPSDVIELRSIPEQMRRLIDIFAPERDGGMAMPPAISEISLHKPNEGGTGYVRIEKDGISVIQTNLSVQVKPDIGERVFKARDVEVPPIASIKEPREFVQLLRQAAIVNTGGYVLTWLGAGEDLKPLFDKDVGDGPGNAARLRLVIELEKVKAGQPPVEMYANALVSDEAVEWSRETILAVEDGMALEGLHEPGVLPVVVTRKKPKDEEDILQRFTSLALEAQVEDEEGNEKGTQYLDQAIPVGPDGGVREGENADSDETVLQYRVALPIAKIAGQIKLTGRNKTEEKDLYALVGGKVHVRGGWRDIYGNAWKDKADDAPKVTMPIHYSDRLVGLTGMPYTRVSYWPAADMHLKIGMISNFDALLRLDGVPDMSSQPDPGWIDATLGQILREVALLERAISQLNDHRVQLHLKTSLGAPTELTDSEKGELQDHCSKVAKILEALSGCYSKTATRAELKYALEKKLIENEIVLLNAKDFRSIEPSAMAPLETTLTKVISPVDAGNFKEFSVSLAVARPDPKIEENRKKYYPISEMMRESDLADGVLLENDVDVLFGGFPGLAETIEELAPNLVPGQDQSESEKAFPQMNSGSYDELLTALAKSLQSTYQIAFGHGEGSVGVEKAIWLIRNDYVNQFNDTALFESSRPLAFSFPPLSTQPHSVHFGSIAANGTGLENLKSPPSNPGDEEDLWSAKLIDVDADAYGRDAFARIEEMASAEFIERILKKGTTPAELLPILTRLHEVKRGVAEKLAGRARLVYELDNPVMDALSEKDKRQEAIANSLTDLLRRDLRTHERLTSAMVYFQTGAKATPPMEELNVPVAHGYPVFDDKNSLNGLSAQGFNIKLPPEDGTAVWSDLLISFERSAKSPLTGRPESYGLPNSFTVSHLQRLERAPASSIDIRYQPTAWLRLHKPVTINLPGLSETRVPSPLRKLPVAPIIRYEGFAADMAESVSTEIKEVIGAKRKWRSIRQVEWEAEGLDRLYTRMIYKITPEPERFRAGVEVLRTAVVRFILETDLVMEDLRNGEFENFEWAVSRASLLLDADYDVQSSVAILTEDTSKASDTLMVQETELTDQNGRKILRVEGQRMGRNAATLSYSAVEAASDGERLVIPIDVDEVSKDLTLPLDNRRHIEATGLDILQYHEARTELAVTRNESIDLNPGGTSKDARLDEAFIYRLPVIASGEAVVPLLDIPQTVELVEGKITFDEEGHAENLETVLLQIFKAVVDPDEINARDVVVDATFEYETGFFTSNDAPSDWSESGGPIVAVVIGLELGSERGLAERVAEMSDLIAAWTQRNVVRDGHRPLGSLVADIRVFSVNGGAEAGNDQRNILRLRRVKLSFETDQESSGVGLDFSRSQFGLDSEGRPWMSSGWPYPTEG